MYSFGTGVCGFAQPCRPGGSTRIKPQASNLESSIQWFSFVFFLKIQACVILEYRVLQYFYLASERHPRSRDFRISERGFGDFAGGGDPRDPKPRP